jgi:hypothetical protein
MFEQVLQEVLLVFWGTDANIMFCTKLRYALPVCI